MEPKQPNNPSNPSNPGVPETSTSGPSEPKPLKRLPDDISTLSQEFIDNADFSEYHPDDIDRLVNSLRQDTSAVSAAREAEKELEAQARAKHEVRMKQLQREAEEAHMKRVRKAGLLTLGGTALAGGALYGGKKLYDYFQQKKASSNNTRTDSFKRSPEYHEANRLGRSALLSALGIGAMGYGGYKLYQHFNEPIEQPTKQADATSKSLSGEDLIAKIAGNAPEGWYSSKEDVNRANREDPILNDLQSRINDTNEKFKADPRAAHRERQKHYRQTLDDITERSRQANERYHQTMRDINDKYNIRSDQINSEYAQRMRDIESRYGKPSTPTPPDFSSHHLGRAALLAALGLGAGYGGYKLYQHFTNDKKPKPKQVKQAEAEVPSQPQSLSEEDLMVIRLLSMPPEERALHLQANPQGGPMMHPQPIAKLGGFIDDFTRKHVLRRCPDYIKKRNEIAAQGKLLNEQKLLEHAQNKTESYKLGYDITLEKLAVPNFLTSLGKGLQNLGTKAKNTYFGRKPSTSIAPTPTPQQHGYTKAKDLFYQNKDVGFGKGQFGPHDMGSRQAQMKFQKKLLDVPAGMSASGIPFPSGKELAQRSREALEQAKKIYADKGKPLQTMPRNMQRAFAQANQPVRMRGIYDSPNQAAAAAKQPFFDDWGTVAPKSTISQRPNTWVNQKGNEMPTKMGSLAYNQTLTSLGIDKEAFVRALGRKISDTWQKAKGRSPEFVTERRNVLTQAKEKGEKDLIEKLKVKHGLKEAPAAPTSTSTSTSAPTAPEAGGPSITQQAKDWWGKRSPIAKAGIGAAVAAPLAYGLYHMGGNEYTPQNIDPVYPYQSNM